MNEPVDPIARCVEQALEKLPDGTVAEILKLANEMSHGRCSSGVLRLEIVRRLQLLGRLPEGDPST